MDQGLLGKEAGIVDEKFGGKVVDAVDDDIVVAEQLQRIASRQSLFIHGNGHVRIEGLDLFFSRQDLRTSHIGRMVQNLSLQVRKIDHVAVDQADSPDPSCRQVEGGWRAQTSGTDQQNFGLGNLLLSLAADFRQQNMPTVAGYLVFGKFHGHWDAENSLQLRSQFEEILNVPQRVRLRSLLTCGLVGRLC